MLLCYCVSLREIMGNEFLVDMCRLCQGHQGEPISSSAVPRPFNLFSVANGAFQLDTRQRASRVILVLRVRPLHGSDACFCCSLTATTPATRAATLSPAMHRVPTVTRSGMTATARNPNSTATTTCRAPLLTVASIPPPTASATAARPPWGPPLRRLVRGQAKRRWHPCGTAPAKCSPWQIGP